jgi:hypothetical protein
LSIFSEKTLFEGQSALFPPAGVQPGATIVPYSILSQPLSLQRHPLNRIYGDFPQFTLFWNLKNVDRQSKKSILLSTSIDFFLSVIVAVHLVLSTSMLTSVELL